MSCRSPRPDSKTTTGPCPWICNAKIGAKIDRGAAAIPRTTSPQTARFLIGTAPSLETALTLKKPISLIAPAVDPIL
jgi:hypothetical protein